MRPICSFYVGANFSHPFFLLTDGIEEAGASTGEEIIKEREDICDKLTNEGERLGYWLFVGFVGFATGQVYSTYWIGNLT
jgi:hypothetical protein